MFAADQTTEGTMSFRFNAEQEMLYGLRLCVQAFGHEVVMAIDPKTVCMVEGPGTEYCLEGRCFEIVRGLADSDTTPRQNPETMASIAFYREGDDERTEACRAVLAEYQELHRGHE